LTSVTEIGILKENSRGNYENYGLQTMKNDHAKKFITELLGSEGIKINGRNPWDIKVVNEDFYGRVVTDGVLGFGESYMDGWWDTKSIDQLVYKAYSSNMENKIKENPKLIFTLLGAKIFNLQSKSRAFHVGKEHYDLPDELYKNMLDKRMVYTSAYWSASAKTPSRDGKNAKSLDSAQEDKLDLVCRKIGLKAGMKILDIGCGWGSFAKYAAEKYKVKVVGITISKEQVELGNKLCKGLPVEIRLQDYRDVREKFDHIISLGMMEHVGYKNYKKYMQVAHKCLKENGLFLIQTIGGNHSSTTINPWINKYIFPNAMLPSVAQIGEAIENLLVLEDWHNFGADYDKTLMAWYENFHKNWKEINSKTNLDERFYRMWKLYLLSSAGSFRARRINLWQIVLSKNGVKGGYAPIR